MSNLQGEIRSQIIIKFPLFTKLVLETPFIEDNSVQTLTTNGKEIKYNPDFLASKTPTEKVFKFTQELCHNFLGHHLRITDKMDNNDAQLAADYAVNELLFEAGISVHFDEPLKHKYSGLSFEEIYTLIHQDEDEQFDEQNSGQVEPSPDLGEDSDDEDGESGEDQIQGSQESKDSARAKAIEDHQEKMMEAIQAASIMGGLPDSLQRYLDKLNKPQNNWRDILAEFLVKSTDREDYTFSKPNRRYNDGLIMPGLYSENPPSIALAVDTSGSISHKQLIAMSSDIVGLIEDMQPEYVIVIWCDSAIRGIQVFESGEPIVLKPAGGGMTDFRPPFGYLEQKGIEVDVMVYLTDGHCSSYPSAPAYPVIWAIWQDQHKITPPFGDVVVMEVGK